MFKTLKAALALMLLLAVMISGMCFTAFAEEAEGDDPAGDTTDTTTPGSGETGDTTDTTTPGSGETGDTSDDSAAGDTSDDSAEGGDSSDKDDSASSDSDKDDSDDGHDHDDEEEEEEKELTGFAKFWDSYNQIFGYVFAGILLVAMVIFIYWWIPKDKAKKK